MAKVVFDCDRCGTEVEGGLYDFEGNHFTAGYYSVGPDTAWHQYAQDGEERICDACMWANAEYREVYGIHE